VNEETRGERLYHAPFITIYTFSSHADWSNFSFSDWLNLPKQQNKISEKFWRKTSNNIIHYLGELFEVVLHKVGHRNR
jgi:hypothetical protein